MSTQEFDSLLAKLRREFEEAKMQHMQNTKAIKERDTNIKSLMEALAKEREKVAALETAHSKHTTSLHDLCEAQQKKIYELEKERDEANAENTFFFKATAIFFGLFFLSAMITFALIFNIF